MIAQPDLAMLLTSRGARRRLLAAPDAEWTPARREQLEITAGIVTHKRREAFSRWFPATMAVCDVSPDARRLVDDLIQEPLTSEHPDRRIRCGDTIATALRSAAVEPRLRLVLLELLRLETEILRLTYDPCPAPPPALHGELRLGSRVRVAPNVRLLSFAVDVLALCDRPEVVRLTRPVALKAPVAVALVRRPRLQPVQPVRLGWGAFMLLVACRERAHLIDELLRPLPAGKREPGLASIRQAAATGLLEAA